MESAISHCLASTFTSVPKGHSKDNLSIYVRNRQHVVNEVDLAKLYIHLLDYKAEDGEINIKETLDFSFFEKQFQQYDKSSSSK